MVPNEIISKSAKGPLAFIIAQKPESVSACSRCSTGRMLRQVLWQLGSNSQVELVRLLVLENGRQSIPSRAVMSDCSVSLRLHTRQTRRLSMAPNVGTWPPERYHLCISRTLSVQVEEQRVSSANHHNEVFHVSVGSRYSK